MGYADMKKIEIKISRRDFRCGVAAGDKKATIGILAAKKSSFSLQNLTISLVLSSLSLIKLVH